MFPWILSGIALLAAADRLPAVELQQAGWKATVGAGGIRQLVDGAGRVMFQSPAGLNAVTIEGTAKRHAWQGKAALQSERDGATCRLEGFGGSADAVATIHYRPEPATGDLVWDGDAGMSASGVWGLSFCLGEIPLEYAIVVPGRSGVRLTAQSPGSKHVFDYPIGWEAQLVVVEGLGHGFYAWSDDTAGRYKRLTVERTRAGWRIELTTINDAPFDALSSCSSVRWRLNTYEGDWRVPARRYRQWLAERSHLMPIAQQQPAWVREIRAVVIMGQSQSILEELPRRFIPEQTLLYLPSWRRAGYDRDYPDYTTFYPDVEPFIARAKQLGFRVMLHTNYFGVDPLNRSYADYERWQVRSPWGSHDRQWWLWTRATPEIRFAYINPALRAWRRHFVKAMVELVRRLPIDALHLDQTLCIYNDHNGRIDGQTMLEGNVALHRELREALPQVALGGEGLNEVTCRYEAFAQRHAWGLNHAEGTWNLTALQCAHPISSYLFLPFTTIYGYLGYVPPSQDQLYAAWNEAYEHWGVIPTLKPELNALRSPTGFTCQLLEEVRFWQTQKPNPDLDGPWPAGEAFPLKTADGRHAARTIDGRLQCEATTISRTLFGQNRADDAGHVPGWNAYDGTRIVGLDPERWYPCFPGPGDSRQFHVADLPAGIIISEAIDAGQVAQISTRPVIRTVADLVERLGEARCGIRGANAADKEVVGALMGAGGGQVVGQGDVLQLHPAWKGSVAAVYARYHQRLPEQGRILLTGAVALAKGATEEGRSDGVRFRAIARHGDRTLNKEVFCRSETREPLVLDLSPFAGRVIDLELEADPGPKGNANYDWARWHTPRIEQQIAAKGALVIGGEKRWALALGPKGPLPLEWRSGQAAFEASFPAAICLVAEPPPVATLPLDLVRAAREVAVISDAGLLLAGAEHAGVRPGSGKLKGQLLAGLRVHPPDHGRTVALFPLGLPKSGGRLRATVGLVEGSKSEGAIFAVQVNGTDAWRKRMIPTEAEELDLDLSPWAGQPVVLGLVIDADGSFHFDWGLWGQPRVE